MTSVIARGGMGILYRAREKKVTEKECALKLLYPILSSDTHYVDRFKREAVTLKLLKSPRIVHFFDYGDTGEYCYIAMELVDGTDLRAVMNKSGAIAPAQAVFIISQVLEGLSYAHRQGIIHRDIKPENIMITSSGDTKLTDFGLAHLDYGAQLTVTGMVLGTPSYMSPEQARGEPVDIRTDIFSTGLVFYEMLTGRKPFEGSGYFKIIENVLNEPIKMDKSIPKALQKIIRRATNKEPNKRYKSAEEMLNDLKNRPSKPFPVELIAALSKERNVANEVQTYSTTSVSSRDTILSSHSIEKLNRLFDTQVSLSKIPFERLVPRFRSFYIRRRVDDEIDSALDNSGGVVLIGKPLSGKTRTALEAAARQGDGYLVVPLPKALRWRWDPDVEFPEEWRRCILLMDNAERFTGLRGIEGLIGWLAEHTEELMLIVTASSVDALTDSHIQSLTEGMPRLFLPAITKEEGIRIADENAVFFDEKGFDGTPGSVLMGVGEMKRLYNSLPIAEKVFLRAIKLVQTKSTLSIIHKELSVIVDKIFDLKLSRIEMEEITDRLFKMGFITRVERGILLYPAYTQPDFMDDYDDKKDIPRLLEYGRTSKSPQLINAIGVKLHRLQHFDEAMELYEQALRLDPMVKGANYNIALILDDRGEIERAKEYYRREFLNSPDDPLVIANYAGVMVSLEQWDEAKNMYAHIEGTPQYRNALTNIGIVYLKLGEIEKAEKIFREAVELNPFNPYALFNLAMFLKKKGNTDKNEIKELFSKSLDAIAHTYSDLWSPPLQATIRELMAVCAMEIGKDEEARKYLEEAIALAKKLPKIPSAITDESLSSDEFIKECRELER